MQFLLRSSCGISFIFLTHISHKVTVCLCEDFKKASVFQLVLVDFFSSIRSCSFKASLAYRPLVFGYLLFSSFVCSRSYAQSHACPFFFCARICFVFYAIIFLGRSFNYLACLISSLSFRILYVSRGLEMRRLYRLITSRSMSCVKL